MCISNQCGTYFRDVDGDGFGAGTAVSLCSSGSVPAGYSATDTDCCDTDPAAKPGQTSYFPTARIGCGGYDYNCDVVESPQYPTAVASGSQACFGTPPCIADQIGYRSPVPGCNGFGSWQECNTANCTTITQTRQQSCR
jgi:hypothetical protein